MRRSAVGHGLWRCHSQPIKGRCHGCTALRRRSTRSPLPSPPLHTTPVQVAITVMTALPPPDPNRKTPAPSSRRRLQRSSTDPSQPAQVTLHPAKGPRSDPQPPTTAYRLPGSGSTHYWWGEIGMQIILLLVPLHHQYVCLSGI
jgi:hypothetical protein